RFGWEGDPTSGANGAGRFVCHGGQPGHTALANFGRPDFGPVAGQPSSWHVCHSSPLVGQRPAEPVGGTHGGAVIMGRYCSRPRPSDAVEIWLSLWCRFPTCPVRRRRRQGRSGTCPTGGHGPVSQQRLWI